ncbi:unnamed protein product [Sphagnum jensenii]|uniref:FLZ-type domain-containing protein n=1 Tax=Sphagnum jensenii TaxID=128206 RepID=A0ABP0X2U6_9BRYO
MTGKRPRTLRRTSSESLIESVSFTQECSPLPEHPKEKLKPTPVKEPRKVVEGVGLSIVAAMNNNTAVVQEELKSSNIVDRRNSAQSSSSSCRPAAAAIKADSILHSRPNPYCTTAQKQSMSIPILHPEEGERDTFLLRTSSSFKTQQVVVVPDAVAAAAAASAVHFLDACYFCKRHLVDGKDIYMYRGDKAFCSTECRSQQIMLDERHENCLVAALKKTSGAPSHRNRVVAAAGTAAAA